MEGQNRPLSLTASHIVQVRALVKYLERFKSDFGL